LRMESSALAAHLSMPTYKCVIFERLFWIAFDDLVFV
jgi:hypothetical protein